MVYTRTVLVLSADRPGECGCVCVRACVWSAVTCAQNWWLLPLHVVVLILHCYVVGNDTRADFTLVIWFIVVVFFFCRCY